MEEEKVQELDAPMEEIEEEKVQEFDASMEERVEVPEYLSLEDVVQKTQAKAEKSSYPWYSVRKMARVIVVGGEGKTHLCMECLTEMTSKAKRTPNDWHAALCNAESGSNVWLHLQRKHRHTTKDAGLMKEFEKKYAKKRKAISTTMKTTTTCGSDGEKIVKKQRLTFNQNRASCSL
jgi:hypothetical protein